jgi:hypothetical protein
VTLRITLAGRQSGRRRGRQGPLDRRNRLGKLGKRLGHMEGVIPRDGEATRRMATIERAVPSFSIEAHGMGAVMDVHGAPEAGINELMARMKKMTAAPDPLHRESC